MTTNSGVPDAVPAADAFEQHQAVVPDEQLDDEQLDVPPTAGVPLESDTADWHDQQLIVPDPDEDTRG